MSGTSLDGVDTVVADFAPQEGLCVTLGAAHAPMPEFLRDELTRVFENLVENALKYGASGKRVEITLRDGAELALDLPAVLGAPGRPLGRERHLEKFRRAAASGIMPLAPQRIESLINLVDRLEQVDDVRELVSRSMFEQH